MWCCKGDSMTMCRGRAYVCHPRIRGGGGQGVASSPLGGSHPQVKSAFAIVNLRATPVDEVGVPAERLGCLHEGIGWRVSFDLPLHEDISQPCPS